MEAAQGRICSSLCSRGSPSQSPLLSWFPLSPVHSAPFPALCTCSWWGTRGTPPVGPAQYPASGRWSQLWLKVTAGRTAPQLTCAQDAKASPMWEERGLLPGPHPAKAAPLPLLPQRLHPKAPTLAQPQTSWVPHCTVTSRGHPASSARCCRRLAVPGRNDGSILGLSHSAVRL